MTTSDDALPTAPYAGYLDRLAERIAADVARAEPVRSPFEGAPAEQRDALAERVGQLAGDLVALSHHVHANPELGFAEHEAVRAVAELLRRQGHDPEVGAWGLATAVHAVAGRGRPRIALLAEYDALPGVGHACGHNIICATAVGAFLALAEQVDDLDGSIALIGTPAEEGGGGKELIARAGGFDDVDAALMLHPAGFEVAEHPWLGVRQVHVTYHGVPAHASAFPFLGRNALDAVVQAYTGVATLRQHILPTDRVHGIITDGGQRPNIVPERASATFYVRSAEPETLAELCERVHDVFEGAAKATGAALEATWDPVPVYLPVRNNAALAGRYAENMGLRGRQVLPKGLIPPYMTGSTDMGNVSARVPSIHPTLAVAPIGVSIHNPEFARWAASERGDRGVVDGAFGLAATALDHLTDADLRKAAEEEFAAAGGVITPEDLA